MTVFTDIHTRTDSKSNTTKPTMVQIKNMGIENVTLK